MDEENKFFFGWLDFTFFILMLAISTMIGVYFGYWGKKEDTPKEYLHGGKTMSTLPVAVSLGASSLSGVTMMGFPTEIYLYGTLYWLMSFAKLFVGLITYYIYLPVFYGLQLTSTYEYLQLRFSRNVRIMASVLCTISVLLYIPIVVYVPALAFSQVSGWNIHIVTTATCILTIFYTMLGGIKAVVWTDFLQGIVMIVSSLVVIVLGVRQAGGLDKVWEINREGGRIRLFEMSLSPFERMTTWNVIIGNTFKSVGITAINQAMVQRFLSLPSFAKARSSLIIFMMEIAFVATISCLTGLLIYSKYHDCDPIKTKAVSRPDQLLPYYVMDISTSLPGLPGLFVAGIFSASLSTMSSSLNSLGATLFEDFVRPCLRNKITDKTANNLIKCVIVIIGAICVLVVFIVDKLGAVLQLTISVTGVTNGAILGLFTMGMFYPRGNTKGALVGSISSLLFMSWIVFGTQIAMKDGRIKSPKLPTSVEGCDFNVTLSDISTVNEEQEEVFILYRISFVYYTLMGLIVVLTVGPVVSLLTEPPEVEKMNPAFYAPFMRKYVEYTKEKYYGTTESNKNKMDVEILDTSFINDSSDI